MSRFQYGRAGGAQIGGMNALTAIVVAGPARLQVS
jgi:hypothetical protein